MNSNSSLKTDKGFGAIEMVVAVVVIAIIGVAGWMYLNNNSSTAADDTNTANTSESDTQTYTSATYGISFDYPKDWTVGVTTVESFPDQENIVVKDAGGEEVLGIYGYLGTGCESPAPTNPESHNLTIAGTDVTVTKSCNDAWAWVTAKAAKADMADNDRLVITTWDFIGTPNEEAAKELLSGLSGVSEVKASN